MWKVLFWQRWLLRQHWKKRFKVFAGVSKRNSICLISCLSRDLELAGKVRFILIQALSVWPEQITCIPVTHNSQGNLPSYKQTLTIMQNASPPGILWATEQVSQSQCCVGWVSQPGVQWSSSLCVLNVFSSYRQGTPGRIPVRELPSIFWAFGHSCYA